MTLKIFLKPAKAIYTTTCKISPLECISNKKLCRAFSRQANELTPSFAGFPKGEQEG